MCVGTSPSRGYDSPSSYSGSQVSAQPGRALRIALTGHWRWASRTYARLQVYTGLPSDSCDRVDARYTIVDSVVAAVALQDNFAVCVCAAPPPPISTAAAFHDA